MTDLTAFYNFPHKKTDDIGIGKIETDDIESDEMEADRIKIMRENDKSILTQYLKDLLDLDLKDYVEAAEGEVTIKEDDENSSMIKIEVLEEYEDRVLEILRDNFWESNPYDGGPPFRKNSLIEEVNRMYPQFLYPD